VAGAAGPPDGPYDADIIILSLGRTEDTIAAIASAREQAGVSAHVFVLDQGSQASGLARLAAAVGGDPRVTLLAVPANLGVAGGRNLLSGLGRGRVIVGLDNDAVFGCDRTVARLVAALDGDPALAAAACRIVADADGTDDLSSWGYPAALLPRAGERFDTITFVGAGHAIRRRAWEEAGGYDPKLFFCWEEYDFCLRAIALGWRIRYCGDITVRHKVAAERRVRWSGARWFYFVRNRLYIERKLGRTWLSLAPRAAAYLLKGTLNGRPLRTLHAIRAARARAPRGSARTVPDRAQAYLRVNDRAHRGSLLQRLKREVLGPLGAAAAAGR
jgi:GT2 family glycosyltransferase